MRVEGSGNDSETGDSTSEDESTDGVSSGVGDSRYNATALVNGALCGKGEDTSIGSIPGEDGIGGVIRALFS